jgi:hypothetical protein
MTATLAKPIQTAVFDSVPEAMDVVLQLRAAGFTAKEISVLSSDPEKLEPFHRYIHERPAGEHTEEALSTAGTLGLGLASAVIATALVTTGGAPLFVIGAFTGLGMVGTFVAAMLTRGTEKELADFYDQSMTHGKLLVAIETDDPARQAAAQKIFEEFHAPGQPLDHED